MSSCFETAAECQLHGMTEFLLKNAATMTGMTYTCTGHIDLVWLLLSSLVLISDVLLKVSSTACIQNALCHCHTHLMQCAAGGESSERHLYARAIYTLGN